MAIEDLKGARKLIVRTGGEEFEFVDNGSNDYLKVIKNENGSTQVVRIAGDRQIAIAIYEQIDEIVWAKREA